MDSLQSSTKYYFASVKYRGPVYSYMGVHCTTRILDKYEDRIISDTFTIDHSPTREEIINHIIGDYEAKEYRDVQIICYSSLSEEDYLAYNK